MSEPGPLGYFAYEPPASRRGRPAVILWFRTYAILGAVLYGTLFVAWLALLPYPDPGPLALALLVPVLGFHLVGAALPYKPWAWTYGLVLICFGFLSCLLPVAIALLVHWNAPQTKAAFQRM